ncbi:MAG: sulfotransferase domain-containing protein [Bacteroidota bacterium]|nr:sulfotransferase domain-containing protein [Bacteroidota bacterium]
MKILQGGAPKCGNFWLYQILQQILKRSGQACGSFIEKQPIYKLAKEWDLNYPEQAQIDVLEVTDLQLAYRISSIFKMPIENFDQYVDQSSHVWTHSPICKRSQEVFKIFDKYIYIIRDPRDRAISASKYYCSPYMLKYFPQEEKNPETYLDKNFEQLMHEWVWQVYDHLRYNRQYNIHIIFYENLISSFQQELESLLKYLQVNLEENEKYKLEESVSFDTLKIKNPKHLNKGTFGYWKDQLTESQTLLANKIAGPLMNLLGYPLLEGEKLSKIEIKENPDYEALRLEIIRSQQ